MSTELEKIKNTNKTLKIGGVDRVIKFTFSAWAKLEEDYGSLENLEKQVGDEIERKPFTIIRDLAWAGLQDKQVYENGKPNGKQLDKMTFLDDYDTGSVKEVTSVVMSAFYGSLPTKEDGENSNENDKENV